MFPQPVEAVIFDMDGLFVRHRGYLPLRYFLLLAGIKVVK